MPSHDINGTCVLCKEQADVSNWKRSKYGSKIIAPF